MLPVSWTTIRLFLHVTAATIWVGGQFTLARQIPGKEEYGETLRYFTSELAALGVEVRTGVRARLEDLVTYDRVVLATGVTPRVPDVPGIDHPCVVTYQQVLRDHVQVGERVAIMGAGGIGVDVATYLSAPPRTEPYKTHLAYVRERRSAADGEAILAEALAKLRGEI